MACFTTTTTTTTTSYTVTSTSSSCEGLETPDNDEQMDSVYRLLANRGPSGKDKQLRKALTDSCVKGRVDILELLINHKVRVDPHDGDLRKAFIHACCLSRDKVVGLLMTHGGEIKLWGESVKIALLRVCISGYDEIILLLIKFGVCVDICDNNRKTPLMLLCIHGHEKSVELLVKHGANVNLGDNVGNTVLMFSIEKEQETAVEFLLEHGADPNTSNCEKTALLCACKKGNAKIVELLIQHGANLDVGNRRGEKPLMQLLCQGGHIHLVENLLNHGANVNSTNTDGKTALMYLHDLCIEKKFISQQKIYTTKDDISSDIREEMSLHQKNVKQILRLLIKHGADINACDTNKKTVLMYLCDDGFDEVVDFLINNGADINACDYRGKTPLMYACCIFDSDKCPTYTNDKIVELLVQNGANVNAKDDSGYTPLIHACINKQSKITQFLLKNNIEVDARSNKGSSALMCAVNANNLESVNLLLCAGAKTDFVNTLGNTVFSLAMTRDGKCLKTLLESDELFHEGSLKHVHKHGKADLFNIKIAPLLMTLEYGIFEWEWCPSQHYKPVALAALNYGLCPGQIKCHNNMTSPLILSFINGDSEATETFLRQLYYFPEDYRILSTNGALTAQFADSKLLENLTLHPLSLLAWSFLTISKAISLTGPPTLRGQRVDSLPIPETLKNRLKFKMDINVD